MRNDRDVDVFLFTALLPERKCKDKTPGGTTYQTGQAVDLFIVSFCFQHWTCPVALCYNTVAGGP